MRKNIGKKGRFFRGVMAIGLFGYALWSPSWIALAAGLFVLFEVYFSWCALNALLGRNSCDV
jgi:hypothetical protein